MKLEKIEYYFYEWMIIEKKITEDQFKALTEDDFKRLREEFTIAFRTAVFIDVT